MSLDGQADERSDAMLRGWFRFPRSVFGLDLDADHLALYVRILGAVNYSDGEAFGCYVPSGSMLTAWRTLGKRLWPRGKPPSIGTLRKRVDKLIDAGLLTIKPTPKFSLITVVGWGDFGQSSVSTHADTLDESSVSTHADTLDESSVSTHADTLDESSVSTHADTLDESSVSTHADTLDESSVSTHADTLDESSVSTHADTLDESSVSTHADTLDESSVSTHADTLDESSVSKSEAQRVKIDESACQPMLTHKEEGIKEGNKKKSRKKAQAVAEVSIPTSLRSAEFEEEWRLWLRYRSAEKRKKVSETTAMKQLEQLAKYGVDGAIESLRQSMCAGWTGLFEPKTTGGRTGGLASSQRYPLSSGSRMNTGSSERGVL